MSIQKNAFDIPMEGVSSQYMTMAELMDRYASCMAGRNYYTANLEGEMVKEKVVKMVGADLKKRE